ncbi:hypothetical protein OSTOST_17911 [Ostertagia ostertagi]
MFVNPWEATDKSLIENGDTPLQNGLVLTSTLPLSFWIWFYLSVFCNLLCFALNAVFSAVNIIERHRTFRNSFHTIVLVFSLTVVVGSSCKLAYVFVGLAGVHSKDFDCFSAVVDMFISYFSALLMFFMGLNRFAAFSSSYLKDRLMKRKTHLWVLLGLSLISALLTVAVFEISGMKRVFGQNAITDYANRCIFVQVLSYFFYALPLTSSIFYLFAYKSLQSQRENVVSDATKSLLDRAERCNLKTGIWILVTYLASLMIHIAMQFPSVDGTSLIVLNSLGTITSTAPQLAVPLSVLMCSKEARDVTSRICWSSVKSSLSSVFGKRRISSASSVRTLPIVTTETTPT